MPEGLLERDAELDLLATAIASAAAGAGCVVLVTGEAGIGKSSLVRAFVAGLPPDVRVLSGSCDDLLTPRTLGPLREAFLGTAGPLEAALLDGDRDAVYDAVLGELGEGTGGNAPAVTVLVVEDVQWADDGTLDVLRFVAARVHSLRTVVVLTLRDEGLVAGQPVARLAGALVGPSVHRLQLRGLSARAVQSLAGGGVQGARRLHALTGGNPFFVSEALACPGEAVPDSVVDAVRARAQRLSPDAVEALELLSVVPTQVEIDLAGTLVGGRLDALAEAEAEGMLTATDGRLAFRHELARRAIEQQLPALRRLAYNQSVVRALRADGCSDVARIVHHAVQAGDVTTLLQCAPLAGRDAAKAGSHRQALAHFEAVLPYVDRLSDGERARLVGEYAWELYNAHRFPEAVAAGTQAVTLWEAIDEPVPLGEALVALSRHLYMAGSTGPDWEAVQRAADILEPTGDVAAIAYARSYRGAVLALDDQPDAAVVELEQARRLAEDVGRSDLVALCLNYLGVAMADLGDPRAEQQLRQSLALAYALGHHEYVARAYTNLSEVLYRYGRWTELDRLLGEALEFTLDRGFRSHAYNLEVHRCLLLARRGDWDAAEDGLRALIRSVEDPGTLMHLYSAPSLGRLLARRGDPAAGEILAGAWAEAVGQRSLIGLAHCGIAVVEWAWLTGDLALATEVRDVLLPRTGRAGAAPFRAELMRYLARAGLGGSAFAGCPEPYAAGLRGDWQAAADGWRRAGDPYEEALELADSGDVDATRDALVILDRLDAAPAAATTRQRLRDLGVTRVPRGPQATTRTNPGGLTDRQVQVLQLLADGMTNAEIADRLVLSVRTVDHHVSAVLTRLDLASRREAAKKATSLGLARNAQNAQN